MKNADFWSHAFITHYHPLCHRVCVHLTDGNAAEAEEISSEAFVLAMVYVPYPEAIINLFAYLFDTARHVSFRKRRREQPNRIESLEGLVETGREPAAESDAERFLETREYEATLRVKRGPLTPREKVLLKLHLKGYTCDEIAALLHESEGATRSDLNAVRSKVRYRLSKGKKVKKGKKGKKDKKDKKNE
jgi:RNA polymerase sigma factor (sigma-70 family)